MRCCKPNLQSVAQWLLIALFTLIYTYSKTKFEIAQIPNGIGTDTYLRFLTLDHLLDGNGWYNKFIPRENWPYGLTVHWTRAVDLLLMPFYLTAKLFYPTQAAMLVAALIYQAIILAAFVAGLLKAARHLGASWDNLLWPLLLIALFANPFMMAYFAPARIDHHALLTAMLMWIIVAVLNNRFSLAGILGGIGIWVSIEFFVPLGLISAWIGLSWITQPNSHRRALWRFFWPMLLVISAAMLLEHPLAALKTQAIDILSLPHWTLIALCTIAAAIFARFQPENRLITAAFATIIIFAILFACFPELLSLRFSPVKDPMLKQHFNLSVGEVKSPFITHYALAVFMPILVALASCLLYLRQRSVSVEKPLNVNHIFILTAAISFSLLLCFAMRWSYYALPFAYLLIAITLHPLKRGLLWWLLILIILTAPIGLVMNNQSATYKVSKECERELKERIRNNVWQNTPQTIALSPDRGYELLFFTPHNMLAANNHRNEKGLKDLLILLTQNDEAAAKKIVKTRNITHILSCHPLKFSAPWLPLESVSPTKLHHYTPKF